MVEALLKKFAFILFVLSLIHSQAAMAQEKKNLTIIYTNDVIGEIEPCG